MFDLQSAKTQKSRGIKFLLDSKPILSCLELTVPDHECFLSGGTFKPKQFKFPVFARPAPKVPRHGFVDSRVCKTAKELSELSKLTSKIEDGSEILITNPIECNYSAVISGNTITFSTSNDGATSGKNCFHFYLNNNPLTLELSNYAGKKFRSLISKNEAPFYELLCDKGGRSYIVQVRSAPKVSESRNFIPCKMKVGEIIKARGSLLEWEAALKKIDSKTTIIDHTNGSLASHYAIHAIVNNIPVFTGNLPGVGQTIIPNTKKVVFNKSTKKDFQQSFTAGFNGFSKIISSFKYKDSASYYPGYDPSFKKEKVLSHAMRKIIISSLSVLHNFSAFSSHGDYQTIGLIMGLFTRCAFTISYGEARYAMRTKATEALCEKYGMKLSSGGECGRGTAWKKFSTIESSLAPAYAKGCFYLFKQDPYQDGLVWEEGYGGETWADCTAGAIKLYNACVKGDIKRAIELFNEVINLEHNNGCYLDKVADDVEFDAAADDPARYTIENLSAILDVLYQANLYAAKNKSGKELSTIKINTKCPKSKDTPIRKTHAI